MIKKVPIQFKLKLWNRFNSILIIFFTAFLLFLFSNVSCNNKNNSKKTKIAGRDKGELSVSFPYDLNKPVKKIKLPDKLTEISALSYYKSKQLICLHDENADVFIIDYQTGELVSRYKSKNKGDFEGIELVENRVFLLKSNGSLLVYTNFNTDSQKQEEFKTKLSILNDTEGLAYDKASNSLLIACKNQSQIKRTFETKKNKRSIYKFDLKENKLINKPLFNIDLEKLNTQFGFNKFMPSAIAIHPISRNYYVLSAVGNLLVIVNKEGEILQAKKLDPKIFKQPEGICFDPDGEQLFISNEGRKKGKANILIFSAI